MGVCQGMTFLINSHLFTAIKMSELSDASICFLI